MHHKYASKGVAFMSVSVDRLSNQDAALKFLKKQNATFTNVLFDESPKIWQAQFGDIGGPPAVMVYGRDGKVAAQFNWNDPEKGFTHEDVEKTVEKLLAK